MPCTINFQSHRINFRLLFLSHSRVLILKLVRVFFNVDKLTYKKEERCKETNRSNVVIEGKIQDKSNGQRDHSQDNIGHKLIVYRNGTAGNLMGKE